MTTFGTDHAAALARVVEWRLSKGPLVDLLPLHNAWLGQGLARRSRTLDGAPATVEAGHVATAFDTQERPVLLYEATSTPEHFYVTTVAYGPVWTLRRYRYDAERTLLVTRTVQLDDLGRPTQVCAESEDGRSVRDYQYDADRVVAFVDGPATTPQAERDVYRAHWHGGCLVALVRHCANGYTPTVYARLPRKTRETLTERVTASLVRAVPEAVGRLPVAVQQDVWAVLLVYSPGGSMLSPLIGVSTAAERARHPGDPEACWSPTELTWFDRPELELRQTDAEREAADVLDAALGAKVRRGLLNAVATALNTTAARWLYVAVDLEGVDWRRNVKEAVPAGRLDGLPGFSSDA